MSRFVSAASLDQALEELAPGQGRVLAGGTDLMIHLRRQRLQGETLPQTIVDVSRLPELMTLDLDRVRPYLGAGLTFARLAGDPKLGRVYPVLAQAAASVGSMQVRHTATIGGNAANASPAADGVTALVALGARAEIASLKGRRLCPLSELITAPYKTTLAPDELILGFELDPMPSPAGQVFAKVGRRQAMSVARLNLAVCLDQDLTHPRVVLGSCFPTPRRLQDVEDLIQKGPADDRLWQAAAAQAARHFTDVCGLRSSAGYKVPAVTRITARALKQAFSGLGGGS
ncbi:MAG: FAD binding domain-containing protein [Desulfarculaceae bacterium]|jgi:CO/xanthine dehydrogenase FAD-binding subunit